MTSSLAHLTRITALGLLAWFSLACECTHAPIDEQIKSAPTIVTGRVIKLLDSPERRKALIDHTSNMSYDVQVQLTTVYKGGLETGSTIRIVALEPTNCDLYFQLGLEYVLFLEPEGKDLRVIACSDNHPVARAPQVVAALRSWHERNSKK